MSTHSPTSAPNAPAPRSIGPPSTYSPRLELDHDVIDFFPYGYDERQYNSPGFRAPVGSLMRGRHGQFAEYHTSADDLSFVAEPRLVESFDVLAQILHVVEHDRTLTNVEPYGEPQLGSRGLYRALGGTEIADAQLAMLWVLNQSDGATGLLDISERSGIAFDSIVETAEVLIEHGLLTEPLRPLRPSAARTRTAMAHRSGSRRHRRGAPWRRSRALRRSLPACVRRRHRCVSS